MRKNLLFVVSVISIHLIFVVVTSLAEAQVRLAATPTNQKKWVWRKTFNNADLGNLVMAWNGSRLAFSVTEKDVPGRIPGDVIINFDSSGGLLRDRRMDGRIAKLSLNGEGKVLLVEMQDSRLLVYKDFTVDREPVSIAGTMSDSLLSPKGEHVLLSMPSATSDIGLSEKVVSVTTGNTEWDYPGNSSGKAMAIFPFISRSQQVVRVSQDNVITLSDSGHPVWISVLQGRPKALASSALEGGIIAVVTGGARDELRMFDEQGTVTGIAGLKPGATALACSDIGSGCAILSQGPQEQRLAFFAHDGKEVWNYRIAAPARSYSSVVVAAHGNVIIGGFEEKGLWSLRAWDGRGNPLWIASVDGGLTEFKVSWNGKRLASIAGGNRIAFYELKDK